MSNQTLVLVIAAGVLLFVMSNKQQATSTSGSSTIGGSLTLPTGWLSS